MAASLLIGPIIGRVTDTTARIMVVTDTDAEGVVCTLTGPDSAKTDTKSVKANRPVVFVFEGLQPNTQYTTAVTGFKHIDSAFKTYKPDTTLEDKLTFAALSCNKIRLLGAGVEDGLTGDLWEKLADKVKNRELSGIFHLGDQVYFDDDYYLVAEGKASLEQVAKDCRYLQAKAMLEGKPREEWDQHWDAILDLHRSAYLASYTHPPTQYILANVPNFMIADDHEVRDDFGDKEPDLDPNSVDGFLGSIARRAILEYQRQLWEDVDLSSKIPPPLAAENYMSFAIGELGFLIIDTRMAKVFSRVSGDDHPYLTSKQWEHINSGLAQDGLFAQCKTLTVLTQVPPVFFNPTMAMIAGNTAVDDFQGMWGYKENAAEQKELLTALVKWESNTAELPEKGADADQWERRVLLVGGDVHMGGRTAVYMNSTLVFQQLICSSVCNRPLKKHEFLVTSMLKEVPSLGDGWDFEHHAFIRLRNFGLFQMCPGKPSDRYNLSHIHIDEEDSGTVTVKTAKKPEKEKSGCCTIA